MMPMFYIPAALPAKLCQKNSLVVYMLEDGDSSILHDLFAERMGGYIHYLTKAFSNVFPTKEVIILDNLNVV